MNFYDFDPALSQEVDFNLHVKYLNQIGELNYMIELMKQSKQTTPRQLEEMKRRVNTVIVKDDALIRSSITNKANTAYWLIKGQLIADYATTVAEEFADWMEKTSRGVEDAPFADALRKCASDFEYLMKTIDAAENRRLEEMYAAISDRMMENVSKCMDDTLAEYAKEHPEFTRMFYNPKLIGK